jgi:exocyst complex component 5
MTTAQENPRTEPDLSYLASLQNAISILHLLSTSITTVLLPLASPNLTIRRDIEKASTATISNLENKISLVLNRTVDTALNWVQKLLAQQRKTDFRPKEEEFERAVEMLQTPTCLSVYTFLSKVSSNAATALDGVNLTLFLSDLAIGLRYALLEHFRKFSISLTGGLLVSKDVTKYVELVRSWSLVDSDFEKSGGYSMLSEVANLYVIGPEALRERLKNAKPDEREELRKYVEKREDSSSVGVQAVLNAL